MQILLKLIIGMTGAMMAVLWSLAAGMVVSDKRYYLTADGRAVEEGDADASTLLFGKGAEVPEETAKRYGLDFSASERDGRVDANRRQYEAARARGAVEEMRALDARLTADTAADEIDPELRHRLTGGPAESRAQDPPPARPTAPPLAPAQMVPRLTADDPPEGAEELMTDAQKRKLAESRQSKAQARPADTKQVKGPPADKGQSSE